jgi:hypothetical protein
VLRKSCRLSNIAGSVIEYVIAFKFTKDKRFKKSYLVYYIGNKYKIVTVYINNTIILVYKDI